MPNPVVTSYACASPPPSTDPAAMALYQGAENRKIARAIQSLVAVADVQGTTLASASFGATGVKPGTYTNPTVTVAQDGRVTQVMNGDSPFPKGGLSGQFLAADGNGGVSWRYAASSGGGGGGGSSTTVVQGPKPVESADLSVATAGQTFSLSLKPTGVTPGSFTGANLTVDANGRITAVSSGPNLQPSVTALQAQMAALQAAAAQTPIHVIQYWRSPNQTLWALTMSDAGVLTTTVQTSADSITAEDGLTMISTEDSSDYIAY